MAYHPHLPRITLAQAVDLTFPPPEPSDDYQPTTDYSLI